MPFTYPDKLKQEIKAFYEVTKNIEATRKKFNITRPTVRRICLGRKPKRSKWVPKKKLTGELFDYTGQCLITGFSL
jgi:hypothetical protein